MRKQPRGRKRTMMNVMILPIAPAPGVGMKPITAVKRNRYTSKCMFSHTLIILPWKSDLAEKDTMQNKNWRFLSRFYRWVPWAPYGWTKTAAMSPGGSPKCWGKFSCWSRSARWALGWLCWAASWGNPWAKWSDLEKNQQNPINQAIKQSSTHRKIHCNGFGLFNNDFANIAITKNLRVFWVYFQNKVWKNARTSFGNENYFSM